MATLLLELSLTRIFSVVFYYHFAFLAISIALFGLGAGGIFSYVAAGRRGALFARLGALSALNSLLVIVALVTILAQPANPTQWNLTVVYFITALPFFVAGIIVSLAIAETMERVDRVYFFDLMGAGCGCLLLIPLLDGFGGPNTVIAAGIAYAAAAAVWDTMAGSVKGRIGSVALALFLVAFLTYNERSRILDVHHAKGQDLSNEFFQKWNSFSRVAVVRIPEENRDEIRIDADAATGIAWFDFDRLTAAQRHDLLTGGPALPYVLRPGAKALIVGPGGGWDVARALASGSRDITGVEINPIIASTIMRERYPEKSNYLYSRPGVYIYVEDGRSFVRRSKDKYQVLQATLVDTWASTAAGAFALSENSLYTSDAFRDYLSHLTDDGVAVFTRWGLDPPRESLRLVSLAIEALRQLGETEPWRHVIVGREGSVQGWGARDTVLIARQPFSEADIAHAQAAIAESKMQAIYLPGAGIRNPFGDLLLSPNPEEYERNYAYDISPISDNRPFFFYTVQPRDLWAYARNAPIHAADYKSNRAVPLLFGLMAISLLATALTLALPPLVLGTRLPRQRGVRGFLLYFLFIGAGYILIEVGLIQKFVLFLGHPAYALTVVIFSMLVSSGAGSALSRRVVGDSEGRLIKALGCVALLACVLAVALSWLLTALVGLPLPVKIAITALLIAPLGFVMGMPFPTALRRLEQWHAPSVRWAWSLNAAASVMGSVGALVLSIYLGLIQTQIMGGVLYLAALAVAARVHTTHDAAPAPVAGRVVLGQ
jgi:hypothetical protein